MQIGFIGTGVMGSGMIRNLRKAGFEVNMYNRTRAKAEALEETGARVLDTVKEIAETSDVIMTIVGYPIDVEETYFGADGLLENAKEGTIFIDLTTSSPLLAEKIGESAAKRNMFALDAPVSGGDIGAKNGTLSIMVGGDEAAYEKVQPIFQAIGQNIMLHGPAGSGQHAKMSNQIAVAGTMLSVSEALLYANKTGLDPERARQTIAPGAGGSWTMDNLGPRMLKGDTDPGFFVKHFVKDMRIAQEVAKELNFKTPGLDLALELYEQIEREGLGERGTQVIYDWLLSQQRS